MVRVMSFNIRCRSAEDGENNWEHRKSLVVERIRAFDPDIIGMQECRDDEQARYIRGALEDYQFFGVQRGGDSETRVEMAPVLYKKNKFDELGRGLFWLSKTPDVPGSKDWGAAFARTATWVRLRSKAANEEEVVFLNTHLDYMNNEVILESVRMLRRWVDRQGQAAVIISGDFNTGKDSEAYRVLLEGDAAGSRRLQDAHAGIEVGTFHGFGGLEKAAAIDWILMPEEVWIISAAVDTTHKDRLYPSDHYPLLAVIEI